MWLQLLVTTSLAILVSGRTWRCPVLYEALNKTVHSLQGPTTWLDSSSDCRRRYPGFEVLMEDWNTLSEEDRGLCAGRHVPLGLFLQDGVYWRREIELVGELGSKNRVVYAEVTANHKALKTKDDDELGALQVSPSGGTSNNQTRYLDLANKLPITTGGSVNLSNNQWHLVDAKTTYTCTLCQRAWLTSFNELKIATKQRTPFLYSFTARIVKTGELQLTVAEAIDLLVLKLNSSKIDVKVKADGQLVVKSSELPLRLKLPEELKGAFRIEGWRDMDVCPATSWGGIDWPAAIKGYAIGIRLTGSYMATRLCTERDLPDNDFDAVWEDVLYHWYDHEHDCETKKVQKLLRYIQDFASWPPDKRQLSSLLAGSSQIKDLSVIFEDFESRRSVSKAVVDALASLMTAPLSENSISAQCEGTSLACVMASPGPVFTNFFRCESRGFRHQSRKCIKSVFANSEPRLSNTIAAFGSVTKQSRI